MQRRSNVVNFRVIYINWAFLRYFRWVRSDFCFSNGKATALGSKMDPCFSLSLPLARSTFESSPWSQTYHLLKTFPAWSSKINLTLRQLSCLNSLSWKKVCDLSSCNWAKFFLSLAELSNPDLMKTLRF